MKGLFDKLYEETEKEVISEIKKKPLIDPIVEEKKEISTEVEKEKPLLDISNYSSNELLNHILEIAIEKDASDIFLADSEKVLLKILGNYEELDIVLPKGSVDEFFKDKLEFYKKQVYIKTNIKLPYVKQYDFRIDYSDKVLFRVNYYKSNQKSRAVLRLLKKKIYDIDSLNLLEDFKKVIDIPEGLIILSGATGSGKTTTLNAILNALTNKRKGHYITLEDPIEIYIELKKGITLSQRELGTDLDSFKDGLIAAMRQAPEVVLVGETRDYETLKLTIQLAETGHLVFTTFHASNCLETLIRILSMIPEEEEFVRLSAIYSIKSIMSQKLVRTATGQRIPICEYLPISGAIRAYLLNNEFSQLKSLFQAYGGIPFWKHLQLQMQKFNILTDDIDMIKKISSIEPH